MDMVDKGLHSTPQAHQMQTAFVTNLPLNWPKKTQSQKCKLKKKKKKTHGNFKNFYNHSSIYLYRDRLTIKCDSFYCEKQESYKLQPYINMVK